MRDRIRLAACGVLEDFVGLFAFAAVVGLLWLLAVYCQDAFDVWLRDLVGW